MSILSDMRLSFQNSINGLDSINSFLCLLVMSIHKDYPKNKIRVNMTLDLTKEIITILDELKTKYGVASRRRVVEILLQDIINPQE